MPCMNFSGYAGHMTIFSWTIACCLVAGLGLGFDLVWLISSYAHVFVILYVVIVTQSMVHPSLGHTRTHYHYNYSIRLWQNGTRSKPTSPNSTCHDMTRHELSCCIMLRRDVTRRVCSNMVDEEAMAIACTISLVFCAPDAHARNIKGKNR